jgi:exopolysaccharide biosynthesis predicted pyruvyltransferase EpsI
MSTLPRRMVSQFDHITALRGVIGSKLDTRIPIGARCALIDYPDHSNVGDSAIWCGELAYLRSRRAEIVYQCSIDTYRREVLAKRIGAGMVLIHGGGNFGTLYPQHQGLREQVILDFPDNTVIQLPQTVHFADGVSLERASTVIRRHGGVVLLLRDARSLTFANDVFASTNELCPDMAFCLGGLAKTRTPDKRILVLGRTDHEANPQGLINAERAPTAPRDVLSVDWLSEPRSRMRTLSRKVTRLLDSKNVPYDAFGAALSSSWRRAAEQRVLRGVDLLCRGQVVITDRLHAHILCVLLAQPHVVMDNTYGKVRSFYEQWTHATSFCRWAGSLEEAMLCASKLNPHETPALHTAA